MNSFSAAATRTTPEGAKESSKMQRWILGPIVGLLVVIAVNIWMVSLALKSDVGYIEQGTYAKSQIYQQVIDAEERMLRSGWRITSLRDGPIVTITVRAADGSALPVRELRVGAQRADSKENDIFAMATEANSTDSEKRFRFEMRDAPRGMWLVRYELLDQAGVSYQLARRESW